MTGLEVVFCLLGVVALGAGVLVVTVRNVVHAALWLVVTLGALAGEYLLLSAEFVAWVQVLIYVGAVVVLLLFGAMLTRAPLGPMGREDLDGGRAQRAVAALVATGAGGVLVALLVSAFHGAVIDLGPRTTGAGVAVIGESVFRSFVLPFEVISVLLLTALIGAIVLARGEDDAPVAGAPGPGGHG